MPMGFQLPYNPQFATSQLVGPPQPGHKIGGFAVHAHPPHGYASSSPTFGTAVKDLPPLPPLPTWHDHPTPGEELAEVVPAIMEYKTPCPAKLDVDGAYKGHCPSSPEPLYHLIQHLNDSHQWSRERIADWLDTLDVDLTFKLQEEGDTDGITDSGD